MKSFLKVNQNRFFSSKFILHYGIHLGGHLKLLQIETSSVVFGIRTSNVILNLNYTLVELAKTLGILTHLGFYRTMIYFINSIISFRLSFKDCFHKFNKHLFLPIFLNIRHIFRKFEYLFVKEEHKKLRPRILKNKNFIFLKL